jgi:hypothetical protein
MRKFLPNIREYNFSLVEIICLKKTLFPQQIMEITMLCIKKRKYIFSCTWGKLYLRRKTTFFDSKAAKFPGLLLGNFWRNDQCLLSFELFYANLIVLFSYYYKNLHSLVTRELDSHESRDKSSTNNISTIIYRTHQDTLYYSYQLLCPT